MPEPVRNLPERKTGAVQAGLRVPQVPTPYGPGVTQHASTLLPHIAGPRVQDVLHHPKEVPSRPVHDAQGHLLRRRLRGPRIDTSLNSVQLGPSIDTLPKSVELGPRTDTSLIYNKSVQFVF